MYVMYACILVSVAICDSEECSPPMELDDAEGLLGGRGAEGDTVQGKVIHPPGGIIYTSLLSNLHQPPLLELSGLGTSSTNMFHKQKHLKG